MPNLLEKVFGKPNIETQTNEEKQLSAWIRSKVEEVRKSGARISHEGTWMTNAAYMLGFDSVYYDTTSRQFRTTGRGNQPLRRTRLHVNRILPTIQNRLARLCKNPPRYDVRPNSNDVEDKDAARFGLEVLGSIWDKEKVNEKRQQLMMWVQQCGHAYMKVYWDVQKGKEILNPETNEMDYEGDICIDPVGPFEVFPDPLAMTMDEAQWVIQAKVRKLDYFKTHYPGKGDLVKEEAAWLLSTQYELRLNTLNTMGPTQSGITQQMKNAAIELVYYERPSRKHPNGRQVSTANGIVLDDKELPCGEIPFVKFDDVLIAGKFYSESIITHLRPIQDQYNRVISKRAEWTNKLLSGKYMAARGHGLSVEAINDQTGEVVEYDVVPNHPPPSPMNIPVIPQYAYQEADQLEKMFFDISGINEISRGQLPAAGIPAVGMQFLMEQDDTRIGIVTESHENGWARVGSLILKYVSDYYKTPRILKLAGKNSDYMVKHFVGADLKGSHDVIVIKGSTIPGSKVLRRQEILNAWQSGLLGDPADPKIREKVLGMLEYGDVGEVWEDYALDEDQIQQDLDAIENGETPIVEELDNHQLNILKKNRYRKSDKFKKLPLEAQTILRDNIEGHVQAQMRLMNPGLAAQEIVKPEVDAAKAQIQADPSILDEAGQPDPASLGHTETDLPQGGQAQ